MTKADSISQRFKEQHPDLIRLSPDIDIFELLDDHGKPSGKIKINVKHPFVFDIRLIPQKFEGIEVMDITMGKHPKEFPESRAALPWYEMFAPEHYRNFVENNLSLVREKLKQPQWTKEEILNALTGGYEAYVQKCKEAKELMLNQHKEESEFFKSLLAETEIAFNKSQVLEKYGRKYKWGYSVLATSIFKNRPMVVGFNWGVEKGTSYESQQEYPLRKLESNFNEMGSLKRTIPDFYDYYPDALHGMQSNFCFFRSENESQISQADLDLCKPLFLKLLHFSKPSSLVSFSSQFRDYLTREKLIKDFSIQETNSNGKKNLALKGTLNIEGTPGIPVYYLPHPIARIKTEDRKKLWEFCFLEKG